jgi:hypothetical protein
MPRYKAIQTRRIETNNFKHLRLFMSTVWNEGSHELINGCPNSKNHRNKMKVLLSAHRLISLKNKKKTPWFQSASELYRPSDRRLSAKLVPTLVDRGCRVVSATNPHGR